MTRKEILLAIKDSLFEGAKFIEGDGTEFGKQDELRIYDGKIKILGKTGSSWYFPGYKGVDLYTITKLSTIYSLYYYKYKLIDISSDLDVVKSWVSKCINSNRSDRFIEMINKRNSIKNDLRDILKSYKKELQLNIPKIIYSVVDLNNPTDSLILECELPSQTENTKKSLIIQVLLEEADNKIKLKFSYRTLVDNRIDEFIDYGYINNFNEDISSFLYNFLS